MTGCALPVISHDFPYCLALPLNQESLSISISSCISVQVPITDLSNCSIFHHISRATTTEQTLSNYLTQEACGTLWNSNTLIFSAAPPALCVLEPSLSRQYGLIRSTTLTQNHRQNTHRQTIKHKHRTMIPKFLSGSKPHHPHPWRNEAKLQDPKHLKLKVWIWSLMSTGAARLRLTATQHRRFFVKANRPSQRRFRRRGY